MDFRTDEESRTSDEGFHAESTSNLSPIAAILDRRRLAYAPTSGLEQFQVERAASTPPFFSRIFDRLRNMPRGNAPEEMNPVHSLLLYAGTPVLIHGTAVLFDSSRAVDSGRLHPNVVLQTLHVSSAGIQSSRDVQHKLHVQLHVGDCGVPEGVWELRDLLERTEGISVGLPSASDTRVLLLLIDSEGADRNTALPLEVRLNW